MTSTVAEEVAYPPPTLPARECAACFVPMDPLYREEAYLEDPTTGRRLPPQWVQVGWFCPVCRTGVHDEEFW